jgi:transporter family protein
MDPAPWFWLAVAALVLWGIEGIFYKLSTNHVSAESALIWLMVAFFIVSPFLSGGSPLFSYSRTSLFLGLLAGLLNAVASWALLAAMRHGGKASIVVPFTSLYPLIVTLAAPFVLNESITPLQGGGVICALVAVILLAS